MATTTWTGATDGDPTDASNWSGAIPSGTVDAYIPANATVDMDGGSLSGQIGVWEVAPGCSITIGTSGSPVIFSADKLLHYGQGATFYQDNSGPTVNTVIACSDPGATVSLKGDTYTNVVICRGNVTLASTIGTIADLDIDYVSDRLNDATVTIEGLTAITRAKQNGGNVTCSAPVTDLIQGGGTWEQTGTTAITRYHALGVGVLILNTTGSLDDAHVFGGATLNLSDHDLGGVRTVTDLYRMPKARVHGDINGVGVANTIYLDLSDVA